MTLDQEEIMRATEYVHFAKDVHRRFQVARSLRDRGDFMSLARAEILLCDTMDEVKYKASKASQYFISSGIPYSFSDDFRSDLVKEIINVAKDLNSAA